ncbi:PilT protein domain protein [Halothece sp. PCC 7418]|uniref:type II toxin-antitoxin system tRNA(fMet)-specific endonuclease VapC n=1 Tax=Halothece sp. (strain PCC 7418) TaxID=65093 RepID=UPI0002A084AC|nr:type II toxin-antitoxin system VapC family toxin [Halothece sp. PCC 7418]AFZ43291.1 PilT protein domain protein [Halothece sp. PCC 7418]
MKVLLDTNICIYIIKKQPPSVLERLQDYQVGEICISTITLYELMYGVYKSQLLEVNRQAIRQFVSPLEVLPFDEGAADWCGYIRAILEQEGKIIGPMDLQIAAIALSYSLTLITNNEKEFKRIKQLNVENWIKL